MEGLLQLIKMLGDETRLRIMMALYEQSFCVCELVELLNESQPKISKHLARLKDLNLVKTKRSEQFIYYELSIESENLLALIKTISTHLSSYETLRLDYERIMKIKEKPFKCTQGDMD
jgi:ArsR family transcriptional regulator